MRSLLHIIADINKLATKNQAFMQEWKLIMSHFSINDYNTFREMICRSRFIPGKLINEINQIFVPETNRDKNRRLLLLETALNVYLGDLERQHLQNLQDEVLKGGIAVIHESELDKTSRSPLAIAFAKKNQAAICTLLKFASQEVFDQPIDEDGNTALHLACRHNLDDVIKLLIQKNAKIDALNHNKQTALHIACEQGLAGTVNLFLDKVLMGENIKKQDADSNPLETIQAILNLKDLEEETALFYAVRGLHTAIVIVLLTNKARRNETKSEYNVTNCIHLLLDMGKLNAEEKLASQRILYYLLNQSCDSEQDNFNKDQLTDLFSQAVKGGRYDLAKIIFQRNQILTDNAVQSLLDAKERELDEDNFEELVELYSCVLSFLKDSLRKVPDSKIQAQYDRLKQSLRDTKKYILSQTNDYCPNTSAQTIKDLSKQMYFSSVELRMSVLYRLTNIWSEANSKPIQNLLNLFASISKQRLSNDKNIKFIISRGSIRKLTFSLHAKGLNSAYTNKNTIFIADDKYYQTNALGENNLTNFYAGYVLFEMTKIVFAKLRENAAKSDEGNMAKLKTIIKTLKANIQHLPTNNEYEKFVAEQIKALPSNTTEESLAQAVAIVPEVIGMMGYTEGKAWLQCYIPGLFSYFENEFMSDCGLNLIAYNELEKHQPPSSRMSVIL